MLIVFSMFVEQKNKHKILVGMKVKCDICPINRVYLAKLRNLSNCIAYIYIVCVRAKCKKKNETSNHYMFYHFGDFV